MAPGKGKKKRSTQKMAHCKNCDTTHERPVGKNCNHSQASAIQSSVSSASEQSHLTYNSVQGQDPMAAILAKLTSME